MSLGKMRHRIQFQKYDHDTDDDAYADGKWSDYSKPVWAHAANLHGREFYAAAAEQMENTVKFTIRYRPEITPDLRIVFEGRVYKIIAVDNVRYRDRYLLIRAGEVEPRYGR